MENEKTGAGYQVKRCAKEIGDAQLMTSRKSCFTEATHCREVADRIYKWDYLFGRYPGVPHL